MESSIDEGKTFPSDGGEKQKPVAAIPFVVGGSELENNADDDFGDFEEAPCDQIPKSINECDLNLTKTTQEQNNFLEQPLFQQPEPLFGLPLNGLLVEAPDKLWKLPSDDMEKENFVKKTYASPCSLFLLMDEGSAADEDAQNLDEFLNKGFCLWRKICYVEEMKALEYKWEHSHFLKQLFNSLHLQKQICKTASVAMKIVQQRNMERRIPLPPTHFKQSPSTDTRSTNAQQHRLNGAVSTPIVNSLMVPPADFDWNSSGLANPLKTQTRS